MGGSLGSGFTLGSDLKSLEEKAKKELSSVKRNVFISFAYEDIDNVNLLRGQAKNDQNDLEFADHSVKEPFNSENADYIKRKITEKSLHLGWHYSRTLSYFCPLRKKFIRFYLSKRCATHITTTRLGI